MLIAPIINKWIFGVRPSSNDLFIITILAAVFFGLSSLSHLKEALSGGDITWFKNFGIYVIYFILGHLITIHIDSVRISSKNLVLIYLATIIIGVALNYILALHSLGNDNTIISDDTIIGFIATCSIFSLAAKLQPGEKHQKILHEGALNSFGIYLIHPLLLFFCFKFMSLSMSNENVIMISTIFITTCLSYILIATIRKTNFGRLIT
jgi:surface polysaccharide O-acyltransferase-like enzyme